MSVVGEHLRKIGKSLTTSVKAYNEAVGSLETRVLPSARKFVDLGAAGTKVIPDLRLVESIPTEVTAEELREETAALADAGTRSSLPLLRMTDGTVVGR
jgi:DNA recombination protein RmuC